MTWTNSTWAPCRGEARAEEAINVLLDRYYAMTFPAAAREVAEMHRVRAFVLIRAMGHLCGCHQRLNGRSSIPEAGIDPLETIVRELGV